MPLCNVFKLLPVLLCTLLLGACGDDAPITEPVRIAAFGDSLTAGYHIPAEDSVPAQLQERFLAEGHTGVRIMNMGISGDTTQNGLGRLNLVLEAQPDIVLLELGANDILRQMPAAKARENLSLMIEQMQARNITVILAGVEIPGIYVVGNRELGNYPPMFEEVAKEYGIVFYPNFLKGVQGKSDMNLKDGLHPNAQGAEEIAGRLYPLLLEAAQKELASR